MYIDSATGNDSNSGYIQAAPIAGLTKLKSLALAHGTGVNIHVARDSVFNGADLDLTTLSNVVVGNYGSGALPIFDASNVYVGAWQTSVDRGDAHNKVYSVAITQTFPEGYISVWRNGVKPTWIASLAACQATANSFFIPDDGTGSGKTGPGAHTIYFHLPADGNPNSDGAVYRITDYTKQGGIHLGHGAVVTGIHTRRQLDANGSFTAGFGSLIQRCLFEDGVKHESLISSGIYRHCIGWHQHADIRTPNIIMEFYDGDGTGETIKYDDSIVVGPSNDYTQVVVGFSGHNSGPGTLYSSFEIVDCAAQDVATAAQLEADAGSITRLYSRNADVLSGCVATSGAISALDCRYHADRGRSDTRVFAGGAHTIEGLRSYINGRADGVVFTSTDCSVSRSLVVFAGLTTDSYLFFGESGGSARAWDRTVVQYEDEGAGNLYLASWAVGEGVLGARSSNVYYGPTAAKIKAIIDGVTYANPTAFLAAYPETGTSFVNPQVEDAAIARWTAPGIANGAGLERPNVEYLAIPGSVSDALRWLDDLPRAVQANEREPLSEIIASSNLTTVKVSWLDDDVASSDANWATASNAALATDIRAGFEPSGLPLGAVLDVGVGLQSFKSRLRKTTGAPNPTVDVELWESGVFVATVLNDQAVSSTSGQTVTATWNANLVSGNGSDVQCRIVSTPGQGGPQAIYLSAGTAEVSTVTGVPISVAYPDTVNAGELLVLDLTFNGNASNATVAALSGWTAFAGNPYDGPSANVRKLLYWKIGDGTESAGTLSVTPSATTPVAGRRALHRIYRFSPPNNAASPIEGVATSSGLAAAAVAPPDVTSIGATSLAVCLVGVQGGASGTIGPFTEETGGDWTEAVAELSEGHAIMQAQTAELASAGTITGGLVAPSTAGDWVCVGFVVKLASAFNLNTVELGAVEWNVGYDV